jgi:hypothetical protein
METQSNIRYSASVRNRIATPQVSRHRTGIVADNGNCVAQLLTRDAKIAAPTIQAINLADVYP